MLLIQHDEEMDFKILQGCYWNWEWWWMKWVIAWPAECFWVLLLNLVCNRCRSLCLTKHCFPLHSLGLTSVFHGFLSGLWADSSLMSPTAWCLQGKHPAAMFWCARGHRLALTCSKASLSQNTRWTGNKGVMMTCRQTTCSSAALLYTLPLCWRLLSLEQCCWKQKGAGSSLSKPQLSALSLTLSCWEACQRVTCFVS